MPKKLNTCGKPSPQALGKAISFSVALGVPSFIFQSTESTNMLLNHYLNPSSGLYGILYIRLVVLLYPAVTPWTVACQTSLFMEFSRQEYWSG